MDSKPKVICVGLGRTGTMSLAEALNKLGFGPCYHTLHRSRDVDDFETWFNIGQGSITQTQDDLKTLLKDYNSYSDHPVAINFEKLYKAYPDAKFILTTRDPVKWEASMKAAILKSGLGVPPPVYSNSPYDWMRKWVFVDMMTRYHRGKLLTDTQGELLAHNERVIDTIPPNQLLVYEINQGWEPLVKFLGVEKPNIPFPHVNDSAEFKERFAETIKRLNP